MVQVASSGPAARSLKSAVVRLAVIALASVAVVAVLYFGFMARVGPADFGVVQRKLGSKTGIVDRIYGPGLYFTGPGTTLHLFPREIQVLDASSEQRTARAEPGLGKRLMGDGAAARQSHRSIEAINVQTSDGYAVSADVTLLYAIDDPVQVAREFGWGSLYIDAFAINTFRNGVLATLGKMNAESFYHEEVRIRAVQEAEALVKERFAERGFRVERLLLRSYRYADNYEKSLHDKKVAVQLTEKNRKQGLVNEEKAKLQQIESKGNAAITIAESEVQAEIARIKAEAGLYSSQVRARGDTEFYLATAEAKRLKTDALTVGGGRYVVALETAKMFDNIEGAVMTPEQYIEFIRDAWSVIGVGSGHGGTP
jgi:regulator of protease activity HflC (stomatin/prohibitin superfamily)